MWVSCLESHLSYFSSGKMHAAFMSVWCCSIVSVLCNPIWSWKWHSVPWRRRWQPTPAFLPGESHGQRNLAGYSSWGHKKSDMTEWLSTSTHTVIFNNFIFKIYVNLIKNHFLAFSMEDIFQNFKFWIFSILNLSA